MAFMADENRAGGGYADDPGDSEQLGEAHEPLP
jgi:hypothetical protein